MKFDKEIFLKRLKQFFTITLWVAVLCGFFITLGFVQKKENATVCKDLDVSINIQDENFFIDREQVIEILKNKGDSVIDQPVSSLHIPAIEKLMNNQPSVKNAEVYMTGNGIMKIEITQRRPVVRVYNKDGENYYIDDSGKLMPLSENYTARVLIANGNIAEPYSKRYMYSIEDINKNEFAKQHSVLDDLYAIAAFIDKDEFWKSQVQQLYVNENNEIDLIPMVGDQTILFGTADNMEEKFHKLKTFYKEGLNKTGWWNKYSIINLKFKDQIVCTKK